MRRPLAVLTTLTLAGALIAACGSDGDTPSPAAADAEPTFPMTVDNCGRPVTIDKRPERILTIGTPVVNALHAAGAADKVVARAGEFGSPAPGPAGEAVTAARILTAEDPATELIIGTGVDAVISYGWLETTPQALADAGIAALALSGYCAEAGGTSTVASFEDIYADLDLFGRIFGTGERAAGVVAGLKRRVAAVRKQAAGRSRRSAASAYFFGDTPSTNGNRSMIHAQMEVLGLTNAFGDVDKAFIESNTEELIKRDPDVIILSYGVLGDKDTFAAAKAKFVALPGARDMQAVRNDRIVGIRSHLREPDPAAIDGLETLARELAALS
ncbi:MAG: ABC transporter substrate-binding protein [Solirubrobacteraceae bacterium]|nr:ABC transporter substrate-binding protein [Solirubrobacteraceae bacterium]